MEAEWHDILQYGMQDAGRLNTNLAYLEQIQ